VVKAEENGCCDDGGGAKQPQPLPSPRSINKVKLNSSRWTPVEDERLRLLVERFGAKSWHLVSQHMGFDDADARNKDGKTLVGEEYGDGNDHDGEGDDGVVVDNDDDDDNCGEGDELLLLRRRRRRLQEGQHRYVLSHHTAVQCMCRWKNVLSPTVRKGPWTEEEDALLRELVAKAFAAEAGISISSSSRGGGSGGGSGGGGDGGGVGSADKIKWREVAEHFDGRLGKQCRERWYNQLDPSINTGPWTGPEDERLLKAQAKFGNRYAVFVALPLVPRALPANELYLSVYIMICLSSITVFVPPPSFPHTRPAIPPRVHPGIEPS